MSKIIKIAGLWVAAEVIFALGKGHMLSNVRKWDTETGDEIREFIGEKMHDKSVSFMHRASAVVIGKMDDFMTQVYECQKKEERG